MQFAAKPQVYSGRSELKADGLECQGLSSKLRGTGIIARISSRISAVFLDGIGQVSWLAGLECGGGPACSPNSGVDILMTRDPQASCCGIGCQSSGSVLRLWKRMGGFRVLAPSWQTFGLNAPHTGQRTWTLRFFDAPFLSPLHVQESGFRVIVAPRWCAGQRDPQDSKLAFCQLLD